MHQPIWDNLEDYLRGIADRKGPELPAEFQAHLGECAECANQLQALQAQSHLLRSLRAPEDAEPRPGFYARVLERIERQPTSIWSVLLDRKVGFRLAIASAMLVALLGTYLVTSETAGPEFASAPSVVSTDIPQTTEASITRQAGLRQQRQRDAVLVDLASYHQ